MPGAAAAPIGWPAGGDESGVNDGGSDDDDGGWSELGSAENEDVVSGVSGDSKVKVRRRTVGDTSCKYTYVGRWQAVRAY